MEVFFPNVVLQNPEVGEFWKDPQNFPLQIQVHSTLPNRWKPGILAHPRPSRTDDRKTWIQGYDPSEASVGSRGVWFLLEVVVVVVAHDLLYVVWLA